jgi:Flp pilus assembly protein TadD
MPTTTYMVVDPRLDHSIRIPRPDFTVRFGIPNACNKCHREKSPQWAADSVARWYPEVRKRPVHYGEILQAGRTRAPGAEAGLVQLAVDPAQPAIVRATALSLLDRFGGPASSEAIGRALLDPDPIVRLGAVKGIEGLPLDRRFSLGRGSLSDAVRAVRLEAVRVLAPVSPRSLSAADNSLMDQCVMEYEVMTRYNGDRPAAWAMLGNVYAARGRSDEAAMAYRKAISLDSLSPVGYVNLADLYRSLGREDDGERILNRGIRLNPKAADLYYALGLLLIRQGKREEGLVSVGRAVQRDSVNVRYAYVYAVGLHDAGESKRSLRILEDAARRSPYDREILFALVHYYREAGEPDHALPHATTLLTLMPDNPQVIRLYQEVAAKP